MLYLVPHLVSQRSARLWLCARGTDQSRLDSVSLQVAGVEVPVPTRNWQSFPSGKAGAWRPVGATRLHYQLIEKSGLVPERTYAASATLGDERAEASFATLPDQLGNESRPLRVLLSSCYFTGNKRSRLASSLYSQLDRNGLRPHVRIWAGDQVYLDAPWYEFAIKRHSVAELERLHCATYARTWFDEQGLRSILARGANVFCTDDHEWWNNAPHPTAVARDTRKRSTREAWAAMARELAATFQGNTATAQRFRVPPLDFLVLDSRVNREKCCGRLFSESQWRQLRAWSAEPCGLGVLVMGQPVFEEASQRQGSLVDFRLADYESEYAELMDLLGRSPRSTAVLTGDLHFSRITWSSFPASSAAERRITELISSPLALVAGGRLLAPFGDWVPAPAKASLPARHPFNAASIHTDRTFRSSAEGTMLLEFYRRGQRIFCKLMHWRLEDLERPRPCFSKEYFLGNST